MSRMVGTVSRGVRAPIIRSGDDLVEIVTKSVLEAAAQPEDGFAIRDRDVVAMTEAIVARAQGNYASVDDIAADLCDIDIQIAYARKLTFQHRQFVIMRGEKRFRAQPLAFCCIFEHGTGDRHAVKCRCAPPNFVENQK